MPKIDKAVHFVLLLVTGCRLWTGHVA